MKNEFITSIYESENSVFTLKEISILVKEDNFNNLKASVHYYAQKNLIRNIRRGVYAKPNYDPFELAVKIYTPAYISFETVLFKQGFIFQFDRTITIASYLSREIEVDHNNLRYRKLKDSILSSPDGLIFNPHYTISEKERAFLDMLYINPNFHIDSIKNLNKRKIFKILPIYENRNLEKRINGLLE